MSNQAFDLLRLIGELILPALATLYAALGAIWGWPYIEAIVGTIAAVTAFIGALVNGLRRVYNKKEENNEEDISESE
jgi:CDP-diglyceride synthetase